MMAVEELKASFGYLACAFGQLNPFRDVHCTNSWSSVSILDRLGCKVRPHFAVDKVTADTDVAGTMVFVVSVRASHLKVQQHC